MKRGFILLLFLSLLFTSCAGTKYKNQVNDNQYEAPKKTLAPRENKKVNKKKLDEVYQEDVDFPVSIEKSSETTFSLADYVIDTASDNLGVKYRTGGTTKSGFDCSGLVFTSFKAHDISLPRSSYEMAQYGVKIKESEAQKGDLIFFITNGGKRINHVGIITEINNEEIKFIHSSTKLGVIISSTKEPYYKKHYVKVARVL